MKRTVSFVACLLVLLSASSFASAQVCTAFSTNDTATVRRDAVAAIKTLTDDASWKLGVDGLGVTDRGNASDLVLDLERVATLLLERMETLVDRDGTAEAKEAAKQLAKRTADVARRLRTSATKLAAAGPGAIEVAGRPATVVVRLHNPPNMRLRLSFATVDGRSTELEWDPGIVSPLIRRIVLDEGMWSVSPSVEPVFVQQGADTIIIATQWSDLVAGARPFALVGTPTALVAAGKLAGGADQIKMSGWPRPTLAIDCPPGGAPLHTMDEERLGLSVGGSSSQRGMGVAPTIVTETLSILAEIAVERAKSGAMSLVKDKFVRPLCGGADELQGGVTLAMLHLSGHERAFPRTCELLYGLRLEDVLGSGDALLAALRDDLRRTIAPAAVGKIAAGRRVEPMLRAALDIVNRAIDSGSFDGIASELVLASLAHLDVFTGEIGAFAIDPSKLTLVDPLLAQVMPATSQAYAALCKKTAAETAESCASRLRTDATTVNDWLQIAATLVVTRADLTEVSKVVTPVVLEAIQTLAITALDQLVERYGHVATPSLQVNAELTAALGKELAAATDETKRKLCGATEVSAAECARYLIETNGRLSDWGRTYAQLMSRKDAKLDDLRKALEAAAKVAIEKHLAEVRGTACGVRLAVAVIKRCTATSCAVQDVEDQLRRPEQYFAVDHRLPASLCWSGGVYAAPSARLASLQRVVLDGLALVQPVRDAKGRDRAVAALHLMFHVLTQLDPGGQVRLALVEELSVALVEQRYDAALGTALRLARELQRDVTLTGRIPDGLKKLGQLVGAVASYAKVYQSTKNDEPAAAREARKEALESLIDAATDRHERGGKWVVSLGSNVGMSLTLVNQFNNRTVDTGFLDSDARELSVRVPLGVSLQKLPGKSVFGVHAALQVADLGQFVTTGGDGKLDEVRWSSFVSPGAEVGVLIGEPSRTLSVTVHASYAPGLSVAGKEATGEIVERDGVWRYGVSLGYYVPFFDFN